MINRRDFLATTATTLLATAVTGDLETIMAEPQKQKKATISLVKSSDRATAVGRAIGLLDVKSVNGKQVLIKPNFNTADPFPASTHNDTLEQLIVELKKMAPRNITIGERCGPPKTAAVLRSKGIPELCDKYDVGLINFEELPEDDWVRINPNASHWRNGFDVARPVLAADSVIATCCLKTHQYGGVFTMSLKLSVGITHKRNMAELHGAARNMRKMIAEINQVYCPDLILMDGIEVFIDGGPMRGIRKQADVMVAGSDPIAVDVVGLAILKDMGANDAIMGTKIFHQQQIARAVELGLGISRPQDIEIITDDDESRRYADRIRSILKSEAV
jgi:uncharacterized protein (DUF362 family)